MALCHSVAVGLQGLLSLLFTNDGGDGAIGLASNLVGLGGLEKAFLDKRDEEAGVPRSRSERVSHPQSRRSQRILGLWVRVLAGFFPRQSFHTDVFDDIIACTIFVVGALAAAIAGVMYVERFYMVGILAVCQALALVLQQVALWCLANNSDTSFAPGASILVGLGGLEKAFLTKDTEETEVIPVVRAIAAGLFDFFFCQTNCQPKCCIGLSTAQVRAAIECPKNLAFVSIDVHAGVFHSQPRRSQRVLGLWLRVLAGLFHVGVSTPTFAMPAHCESPRLGAAGGDPVMSGKQLAVGLSRSWHSRSSARMRRGNPCDQLEARHSRWRRGRDELMLVITWRTTLKMAMGMLPGLISLVHAVREGDFAHICINSIVAIRSAIFVVGALVATCVGMMLAYHGSACDDQFLKNKSRCTVKRLLSP